MKCHLNRCKILHDWGEMSAMCHEMGVKHHKMGHNATRWVQNALNGCKTSQKWLTKAISVNLILVLAYVRLLRLGIVREMYIGGTVMVDI